MAPHKKLYSETPLIQSLPLGKLTGLPTFLKLENTQPSGSFKLRGLSLIVREAKKEGYKVLISSSGGNAGLAIAYSARHLGIKAKIIVPNTTPSVTKEKLLAEGAEVETYGDGWNEANMRAEEISKTSADALYIHPFDHPTIWEGHSTIVEEIAAQLGTKPSAIITCVGGGGLACGLLLGMKKVRWEDVPMVAMETIGADCFNQSVKENKLVVMKKITSIAVCLGSLMVCDQLMNYLKERPIISEVIPDRDAVDACLKFADDHRILVEPACGATLAAAYSGITARLIKEGKIQGSGPVVYIVCGGANVTLDMLEGWKNDFNL